MSTEQRERLEQAANAGFDALALALGGTLQGVTPWNEPAADSSSQLTAVLDGAPVSVWLSIDGSADPGAEPADLTRAFLEAVASTLGTELTESTPDASVIGQPTAWRATIDAFVVTVHWTQEFTAETSDPSAELAASAPSEIEEPLDGLPEADTRFGAAGPQLGRLAGVMLDVAVELGRTRIPIRDLLSLDQGGVVKLGRALDEPVELVVNGMTTARGEMVVVDGRLGLRVTELID